MEISKDLFTLQKKKTTVEKVITKIKNLLLSGKLKSGDRLPSELELADSFNISRGSVREAMKILSALGVVEIKRGNGTYIASSLNNDLFNPLLFQMILEENDAQELFDLREEIEKGIISLIFKNSKPEDIQNIEDTHLKLQKYLAKGEIDPEESCQLDLKFHYSLAEATHNKPMKRIYDFVLEFFVNSIKETHKREHSQNKNLSALKFHKNILKAIKNKNQTSAYNAIKESIIQWQNNYFQ